MLHSGRPERKAEKIEHLRVQIFIFSIEVDNDNKTQKMSAQRFKEISAFTEVR